MPYEKRTLTNEGKTFILDKFKNGSSVKAYFEGGGSTWYRNSENDNFLISGKPHFGPETFYPFYFYYEGQTYGLHALDVINGVRKLLLLKKIEPTIFDDFKSELTQAFQQTEHIGYAGKEVISDIEIVYYQPCRAQ